VHVRVATEADWPAIWPIWHAVVAAGDTYVWEPTTPEDEARRLWMLPPPAEVLVAEDDGEVVGTIEVRPNQPGQGSHVANFSAMVAPDAAGRGIGRALAVAALERARQAGYRAVQFNAVVATNVRALALWQDLGFRIVGTVPGAFRHPTEGDVDLHVMHRWL
jgi:L-amino acid N-acyltransferase YncA